MDTEVIATSSVKASVSVTDYLSPYINERDKEPIWDGSIYVFSDKSKSNESCKGRVPVQVKSKECNDLTKDTITYPIRTDDLKKYLTEDGVIYFVVYVANGGSTRIYYTSLLPFKIKQLLNAAGEQKTKSASLNLFPTDDTEKVDLFFNFLRDREQQKSISNMNLMSIEELVKMGQLKELSFGYTTTRTGNQDPFDYLFNHSIYMYATVPLGIKIPVEILSEIVSAKTTINRPVSSNGTQYYDSYNVIHKKQVDEFHFGESIVFEIIKDMTAVMKYNLHGKLRQRITDLAFLMDIIESGSFNVGDIVFPVKPSKPEEIEKFRIDVHKKHLEHLKNIQAALDAAGVTDDLDCDAILENDEANIRILIDAFVYYKSVSLKDNVGPIGKMTISNLCIMLIARKQEDGSYLLSDFFKDHMALRVVNEKNGEFDTSQFTLMNKDNFLRLSNIDYNAIYNDIIKVDGNKLYYGQITQLLLEMLLAYDEASPKNEKLLQTAYRISEWLMRTDENSTEITLLNYLQTVKRSRDFNEEELNQLNLLIENGNVTDAVLTGAYILLENSSGAKLHYDKLPPEEKEGFLKYPIYNLWKRHKN